MTRMIRWSNGTKRKAPAGGDVTIRNYKTAAGESQQARVARVIENWRHDPARSSEDIASAVLVELLNPPKDEGRNG